MSFDLSAVPTCELVDELKKRRAFGQPRSSLTRIIQLLSAKRKLTMPDRLFY